MKKFCEHPEELVKEVAENILKQKIDVGEMKKSLKPFKSSNSIKVDQEVFFKIEETLRKLREKIS